MAGGRPVDFASGDHYTVLGVPRGASEADITRAYKNLARRYHPDKNPEDKETAELSFKRISLAYAVLHDPERRREYDLNGGSQSYVSYEEAERMWRGMSASNGDEQEGLPAGVPQGMEQRRKAIGLIMVLVLMATAPRTTMQLLPGVTAAFLGVALLSRRREQPCKSAWVGFAVLLGVYIIASRRSRPTLSPTPMAGADLSAGVSRDDAAVLPLGVPHSGEEVLVGDTFVRIADPKQRAAGNRSVEEGWQQRLLGSMTSAIRLGQEQVVMVFSRQGCPWCDRQLPVLQRAIQRRGRGLAMGDAGTHEEELTAKDSAAEEAAPEEAKQEEQQEPAELDKQEEQEEQPAAPKAPQAPKPLESEATFLLPGVWAGPAAVGMEVPATAAKSGVLLDSSLRVFIYDAEEFPYFAQTFRVEAFPTTIAWGSPGVTPLAAQGYLDDDSFGQLLEAVATATPEGKKGGRKGLFR